MVPISVIRPLSLSLDKPRIRLGLMVSEMPARPTVIYLLSRRELSPFDTITLPGHAPFLRWHKILAVGRICSPTCVGSHGVKDEEEM